MSIYRLIVIITCWWAVSLAVALVFSAVVRDIRRETARARRNSPAIDLERYRLDVNGEPRGKRAPFVGCGRGRD